MDYKIPPQRPAITVKAKDPLTEALAQKSKTDKVMAKHGMAPHKMPFQTKGK